MLFTIGYSNRSMPDFLNELQRKSISSIIDVRSSPRSRNPLFNQKQMEEWLACSGILYRHCGEILGGQSSYALESPEYLSAIDRLAKSSAAENIAVMCAEGDPAQCHRTWDIGASLIINHQLAITSIRRDGTAEPIRASLKRVVKARFSPALKDEIEALLNNQNSLF